MLRRSFLLPFFALAAAAAAAEPPLARSSEAQELWARAQDLSEHGRWREARDIQQDLLCRSERDGYVRGMALALVGLAKAEASLGNPAGAETLLQRALGFLPLVDEERGEALEAAALRDLGGIFLSTGRLDEGIAAYREARQLFARAGRSEQEAMSLVGLGQELAALGEPAGALAALDEAEAVLRRLPSALAQEGALAVARANVEFRHGKFQDALARLYKAQDLFRQAGSRQAEAGVLVLISAYQEFLGREEEAVFVKKTEALVGTGVAPELSQLLDPLRVGDLLQQGKPEEAVELGRELLARVEASEDGSAEASIRLFLALSYFELGRNAEAREELAAIARLPQGPQSSGSLTPRMQALARMLGTLDAFLESATQLGDMPVDEPEASSLIQELAKDFAQDSEGLAPGGREPAPHVAVSLHEIGILESLAQGDQEGARQRMEETVALIDRWAQGLTLGELKSPFFSRHLEVYAQAVEMNLDRPEEAFRYAEEARARAFLDGIGNQKIAAPRGADSALLRQERQLRLQLDRLKRDLRSEQRKDPQDQSPERLANLQRSLEQAGRDWEELGLRLKTTNPDYASLVSVSPASLGEIQGEVLDSGITLIEYFVPPESYGEVRAWVIDRSHFVLVPLRISAGDLKNRVELFRNLIESSRPVEPLAAELYGDLFAPLAAQIRHRNLVIVPHGVLHFLPFAALWDGKSYLGDSYALSYSPSATALKLARAKKAAAVGPILAVGNPDGSLQHAATEAETVARRYGARPLLGAAASEGAVVARAGQAGILHLAAHAVLNPVNPLFTRIELAPDEGHDGSLEMHEVFGLDLARTGLVVLSACRTQLGRLTAGDEIEGLTRAFLYAGTPAVMSSLWDVQDDSTSFLMERFYTHLRRGQGRAEALRRAQIETRRRHPHPYHWAAFVLTGDGR
ncbi:MAG TPA: CHAT domain-containing protein [Thermoanaerobaculia bacterium]